MISLDRACVDGEWLDAHRLLMRIAHMPDVAADEDAIIDTSRDRNMHVVHSEL
jgi:hypothetical protein